MERAKSGRLAIVPIIVMPSVWRRYPWLTAIQARPRDGRALLLRKDGSAATAPEIANDLAHIVDEVADLMDKAARQAPAIATAQSEKIVLPPAGVSIPDAPGVSQAVTEARAAVQQVTEAMSETSAILAEFETAFRDTSVTIRSITGLKELHDELHTLEQDTFAGILSDQGRVGQDAESRERLADNAARLLDSVHQARAIAQDLPSIPGGRGWIDQLDHAHQLLVDAVAHADSRRATSAVTLLNRVLDSVPVLLNEQIVAHTRSLNFRPVQVALETVRRRLVAGHATAPAKLQELRSGIDALSQLKGEFRALVEQHNHWQHVELSLRTIETTIGGSLDQLEFLWKTLREESTPLFTPMTQLWASDLAHASRELGTAIESLDRQRAAEARKLFRRFRRLCGKRFFEIDEALRAASQRLSRFGDSLQLLLRMLDNLDP